MFDKQTKETRQQSTQNQAVKMQRIKKAEEESGRLQYNKRDIY